MKKDVILCQDCKYYRADQWSNMFGLPVIVAHNVCNRFGIAVKEDGFCFLAEPKSSEGEKCQDTI